MSTLIHGAALASFVWTCAVFLVQGIGIYKLFRHNSRPLPKPVSPSLPKDEVPHITIIRPVKGVEAGLYECLASTFRLTYPKSKLTIYFCVASKDDPAYPLLQRLVVEFPEFDAKVLVEDDDPLLHGAQGHVYNLGPNPKIRNMSRAYREAKGDIIWIVDCNVWVGTNSAGRMVDKLCGYGPDGARTTPYKFVHQLPLVFDVDVPKASKHQTLLSPNGVATLSKSSLLSHGGRLEETFMSTSHAKFYSAINTVSLAPCIIGKSNMFRKSHLDAMTDPSQNPLLSSRDTNRGRGLDFFSSYICEDHLIGDLIWRSRIIPGHKNHGLVFGEVAIQPVSGMSVASYIARRVRWLRVRKWTVLVATLVEPGVECFLCCLYLSFALTTLPWFHNTLGIPRSWSAMFYFWLLGVTTWMAVDRWVSSMLQKLASVDADENTPAFALGSSRHGGIRTRPFSEWVLAWLGREALALPIWTWAVLLGTTVAWRGKKFRVGMDMRVVEIGGGEDHHNE
ncbi:ceramide glucosyltransferase-like protein [Thermochaetoides thermophila DSM 1495]|uniref:Ceramide glucosyltransferase n=1 Tax=Chaetomium thermophilum (strain DSM 1495 / CBS 144.50 / IMI 039719) TaxID=759272 RepID=G0SHA2_CHATD|nr:ceramide glucosyltransferase-like protein [Thermochaetoides thermophila DSM 1495]EGS17591.1 ceramide glucosyltransferase-like protein [Thermochaetoides thermophila DSM 1495]